MSLKGNKDQVVTQKLDPATEAMQREVYQRGQAASTQPFTPYKGQTVAGVSDLSSGAAGQYRNLGGLAGLGGAAIGGDPNAFAQFQNPFQQNVIDSVGQQYDQLRGQAHMEANDAATKAGAFGGTRHAVMEGARLGQLDQGQASTVAGLQQTGFNDAQARAQFAANFGMGALGQQFQAGDYMRNVQQQGLLDQQTRFNDQRDWSLRNLDVLKGSMTGTPYGSSQSQPLNQNRLAGAAGGALTGFAAGGPVGGIIGGIGGLLG